MIRLEDEQMAQVNAEARRAYPRECVGALLGHRQGEVKRVREVVPLANVESNAERRYLVNPADYRRLEDEADGRRLAVLGFYHSHPDVVATPSVIDLELASPFFSYVIVSVRRGRPASSRSWVLRSDRTRFEEEEIVVADGGDPRGGSEAARKTRPRAARRTENEGSTT